MTEIRENTTWHSDLFKHDYVCFLIQMWHTGITSVIYPEFLTSFILLQVTWTKPELALAFSKSEQAAVVDVSVTCVWHIKGDHMGGWHCLPVSHVWFSSRTEKRSQTDEEMPQIYFSSSKRNCIFYQMTTSVMFLSLLSLTCFLFLTTLSFLHCRSLSLIHSLSL